MIKKLCLYNLDCIKSTSRNSDFVNLKRNKENKIILTDLNEFEADDKEIIEIMTKHALNRSIMGIYKGFLIVEGMRGKEKIFAPLFYTEAELKRENEKIKFDYEEENLILNVCLISSLLDNNADIIENVINQLMEIETPQKINFIKVLGGLVDLNGLTIQSQNALILARMPESIAGLINELKTIAELY